MTYPEKPSSAHPVARLMKKDREDLLPPSFIELLLTGDEPAWCVDGRPDPSKPKGPQMLGGSLHPILLSAIAQDVDFDEDVIRDGLSRLEAAGHPTGAHEGSHKDPDTGKSDCGFADMMPVVLQTALDRKDDIVTRLKAIYEANKDKIGETPLPFEELIEKAFADLRKYSSQKIMLTGAPLIQITAQTGATIECVEGDHAEEIAFVNIQRGTTFDTVQANRDGRQAFNLDLWAVIEQSGKLGVEASFALAASLILYLATEIVLVEMKGKPAVSVAIH